jgi:hypothetical protein
MTDFRIIAEFRANGGRPAVRFLGRASSRSTLPGRATGMERVGIPAAVPDPVK